jgi:hypothetical protein
MTRGWPGTSRPVAARSPTAGSTACSRFRVTTVSTSPRRRRFSAAAYYPAAPLKRGGIGRFYLTPTGNDPAALALSGRASVATVAVHEGFPGHDWHYRSMAERGPAISNIRWLTPGAVEDSSSILRESFMAHRPGSTPRAFHEWYLGLGTVPAGYLGELI